MKWWRRICPVTTTPLTWVTTPTTVVDAIDDRGDLVVVGQSYGGFTAPLVADRLQAQVLVLVAGMIPVPGEAPADWWDNTGYRQAVEEQAQRDGGLTGNEDPFVAYFHDVPRALAEEALSRGRSESEAAYHHPWPLETWPDVPDAVRAVHRGSLLPACVHARGGLHSSRHHSRRDRRRSLRGAQPPEGAGRPCWSDTPRSQVCGFDHRRRTVSAVAARPPVQVAKRAA